MRKLLIVDDKEENLYMLQVLLEGHGHHVVLATNGAEALEKARQGPPDMIISDILMPVMDGYTLCREWKKDHQLKEIPFVFYTATYTDPKDGEFGLSLGAEKFIVKPVDPERFMEILGGVITQHEEGRLKAPQEPVGEEAVYLKTYSERLVKKLEDKMLQLQRELGRREEAEARLLKTARCFKMLSQCNQTMIHAKEESKLLTDLCRIIVEAGGYRFAWVGFAENDEEKTVRPVAHAGPSGDYLDDLNITWQETEGGQRPTGVAIRTGKPAVFGNILNDPDCASWKDEALRYGYQSSIALPLVNKGRAFGALSVYATQPDNFDAEEVKLLSELADDIAHGIGALRAESGRKMAEEKVKALAKFPGENPNPILRVAKDCTILYANEASLSLLEAWGCREGKRLPDEWCKLTLDAFNTGLSLNAEVEHDDRVVVLSLAPVVEEGYVNFYGQDITERKRAEMALRESQERFDLAIKGADLGVWDRNIQTGDTVYDERWAGMLGYRLEELNADVSTWQSLLHPDDRHRVEEALNRHFQNQESDYSAEFRLRDKSGNWKWVLSRGKVFERDSKGKPIRMTGTHLDITEHKEVEGERKKLEVRLRQAQKMEAIGTLAGGIAHDFNNILASIMGYTEMSLEEASRGSLLHSNLREVLVGVNRAKDLVQQILTFSRETEQELRPVQLKLVVKEALKLLRASLPTTIEIRQDLQSDSALLADPTQAHQVLMNLCVNAGHAMEKKGGVLEVNLVDVDLDADFAARNPDIVPGPHLELTVADTGHGMDASTVARIFDPYFTTKEKGEGTGMGLSVVHGIVKAHGGAMTVYSEPGKGSAFHIYLPVIEKEAKPEAHVEERPPTGTERILFVDDEPPLVHLGKQILEGLGYHVVTHTGSLEALEVFSRQPDQFDLVITDMTMPTMTGDKLAGEMMKIRPDIPIILCTGFSARISEDKAKTLGIRGFLLKPFLKSDMATTIRKVLDQQVEKET